MAGFSLECECLDDDQDTKRQNFELARMVANVIGVKKPPWMELDQGWRLLAQDGASDGSRSGNMNVVTAIREREHSAGQVHAARMDYKENCCESLEMSRISVVEMETAPLEKSGRKTNGMARTHSVFNVYR